MSAGFEYVDGHKVPLPVAPGDAPAPAVSDQRQERGALPDSLTALLHMPEVAVHTDERRCAVVIAMPSYIARAMAPFATDPLQVLLAAQLIEAAEMDEDFRRELLNGDVA